jgi:ParB/RepB/Spo0J family partition protein
MSNEKTSFKMVPLKEIKPDPNQPRKYFDPVALAELTESVKQKGVIQPVMIRPVKTGFMLVVGERRFKAATAAGINEIPAVIRELSNDDALDLQIIENLQRKDVTPMEEAVSFKALYESKTKPATIDEIAARVGKSIYFVRQRMKLNLLIKGFQDLLFLNKLSLTHAVHISSLAETEQKNLYSQAVNIKKIHEPDYELNLDDDDIDRFRLSLKSASFDVNDKNLNPKMGVCSGCSFNTAVGSLFPGDEKEPMCTNGSCYQIKTNAAYQINLKAAVEDPATVLVYSYLRNEEDEKIKKKLIDEGVKVYSVGYNEQCSSVDPNAKGLKESVASGKVLKCFYIGGFDKGKSGYVMMNKSGASKQGQNAGEKIKQGNASPADIKAEINRLNQSEGRKKEIDREKVHLNILDELLKRPDIKNPGKPWQKIDKAIMIYLLMDSGNYKLPDELRKMKTLPKEPDGSYQYHEKYFEQLLNVSDDDLAFLIRTLAVQKWGIKNVQNGINLNDTVMLIISRYFLVDVPGIIKAQDEIAAVRIKRVNKRIEALKKPAVKKSAAVKKPAAEKKPAAAVKKSPIKVVKMPVKKK